MDKTEEIESEAISSQSDKSELEQVVSAGVHGDFELKKGEKRRFLGEFKERIIKVLTFEQVEEAGVYPEILAAIKDIEADKLIIRQEVDMESAQEYIDLARKNNLSFKKVSSPDLKGEIALVVASNGAVEEDEIEVLDRKEKFEKLGLPIEFIKKTGQRLCADCYQQLVEKAPEEAINFRKMSWLDKLLNNDCICQQE
ncbi:YueI family protein [Fuchsiella alkaliacetigena]|uniref:YueI family protein n=1 Tax=Fuchsiella alkaliacetigena TaxID=957042 RepID=UPI00200A0924|nr:YueI family protein [Fuchsiella alkaliacetigena]MCK8824578.1 YueI family protein [Fuchsiella alkaliacetigena]